MTKTILLYESRASRTSKGGNWVHIPSPDAEEMCRAMVAYLQKELRIADFSIEYQLITEDNYSKKPYKTPRPGVVIGERSTPYSRTIDDARDTARDFANGWIAAKHS